VVRTLSTSEAPEWVKGDIDAISGEIVGLVDLIDLVGSVTKVANRDHSGLRAIVVVGTRLKTDGSSLYTLDRLRKSAPPNSAVRCELVHDVSAA
jgi:hypothetical protein